MQFQKFSNHFHAVYGKTRYVMVAMENVEDSVSLAMYTSDITSEVKGILQGLAEVDAAEPPGTALHAQLEVYTEQLRSALLAMQEGACPPSEANDTWHHNLRCVGVFESMPVFVRCL